MTQQTQNPKMTAPDTPGQATGKDDVHPDVSSRLARILGALRARREAVSATEQAQAEGEPPVEWALRMMM